MSLAEETGEALSAAFAAERPELAEQLLEGLVEIIRSPKCDEKEVAEARSIVSGQPTQEGT